MPAEAGRSLDLYIGGQTSGTRISCREKSISRNGEAINITNDDDGGVRTLLNATAEDTIDIALSGVIKSDYLRNLWHNGNRMVDVDAVYDDGSILSGSFHLSSYNESAPYQDAITFEANLMNNGETTYVGATAT